MGPKKVVSKSYNEALKGNDDGRSWAKKVEFPIFEDVDPIGWIAQAEKFFEVHEIHPTEKLQLAFVSMKGVAIHWFRISRQKNLNSTWKGFPNALIQRFGEN
uniref:Retrotransposon gag domain-containing protein n=1 Tax=Cajanus cajan TaxID=3821 RepID=A0A151S2M9_CAJCA|nr:hypothetical protein KK1_029182 [Cajanus cajan]